MTERATKKIDLAGVDQGILFGQNGVFLEILKKAFEINVVDRGDLLTLSGEEKEVQQAETVIKTQRGVFAGAALVLKRRGHRRQVQRVELLDRRVRQHRPPHSRWRPADFRASARGAQGAVPRAGAGPAGG